MVTTPNRYYVGHIPKDVYEREIDHLQGIIRKLNSDITTMQIKISRQANLIQELTTGALSLTDHHGGELSMED